MLYKDKSQPVNKRVEDLLSHMTLEEELTGAAVDVMGKRKYSSQALEGSL